MKLENFRINYSIYQRIQPYKFFFRYIFRAETLANTTRKMTIVAHCILLCTRYWIGSSDQFFMWKEFFFIEWLKYLYLVREIKKNKTIIVCWNNYRTFNYMWIISMHKYVPKTSDIYYGYICMWERAQSYLAKWIAVGVPVRRMPHNKPNKCVEQTHRVSDRYAETGDRGISRDPMWRHVRDGVKWFRDYCAHGVGGALNVNTFMFGRVRELARMWCENWCEHVCVRWFSSELTCSLWMWVWWWCFCARWTEPASLPTIGLLNGLNMTHIDWVNVRVADVCYWI